VGTLRAYDILIAGAGLIGSSIAWLLAKGGLRVILTDAAKCGNEASAAGAGMLAPGGEYREFSPAAQLALQSLAMYPTFIRALEKESGVRIDFRKCGAVELAYEYERWEHVEKRADVKRRFGISVDSICTSTLPVLAPVLTAKPIREWIGFQPGIDENELVIGRVPNTTLWLAYGQYRNGILLTPATAYLLADEILAEMSEDRGIPQVN